MIIIGVCTIIASIINLYYSFYERLENFFWNWPAYGLIAVGLYYDRAYATATMNILQVFISSYGFFIWSKQRNHTVKEMLISSIYDKYHTNSTSKSIIGTSNMRFKDHILSIIGIIFFFTVTYYILGYFNDLSRAIDATGFSITAIAAIQFNYKKLESWLYFIVGDSYSCALAYLGHDWYNFISISLFIILNAVIYFRWRSRIQKIK
jgi:hypothetical protein